MSISILRTEKINSKLIKKDLSHQNLRIQSENPMIDEEMEKKYIQDKSK